MSEKTTTGFPLEKSSLPKPDRSEVEKFKSDILLLGVISDFDKIPKDVESLIDFANQSGIHIDTLRWWKGLTDYEKYIVQTRHITEWELVKGNRVQLLQ